jgi:hypothetical protein
MFAKHTMKQKSEYLQFEKDIDVLSTVLLHCTPYCHNSHRIIALA